MTYNFGDILLVPFPFTDQTTTKKRPTVVISSKKYNAQKPDIIIMAITSQIDSPLKFGEMLISDFENAGLLKPSVIKPVITTIEKSLVIRKLGFVERIKGDHHIFTKDNVLEIVNIQPKNSKAKDYQVKQIRNLIVKYRLGDSDVD